MKNRDTLVGTIAATIGGAVSFLAQMGQFQLLFGGGDEEGGNPIAALRAIILALIAAMIIQLAVSRSREYLADTTGASLTGDPEGLAQALEQLRHRPGAPCHRAWRPVRPASRAGARATGEPGVRAPVDRQPACRLLDGQPVRNASAARGPCATSPVALPPPSGLTLGPAHSPRAGPGHLNRPVAPAAGRFRLDVENPLTPGWVPGGQWWIRRLKEEGSTPGSCEDQLSPLPWGTL